MATHGRRLLLSLGIAAVVGALGATWMAMRSAGAASCTIATITWDGGAGTTSWEDATNWNPDRLPTTTDHVCIPSGAPGTFVSVNASETVLSVEGQKQVRIPGSLEVTSTTQTSALKSLKLSGTLTGAGSRTISGTFGWSSGTIAGPGTTTVAAGATLAVTNAFCFCHYLDGTTLQNNGTASMAVDTYILFYNGATLANAGSFDLADNARMYDQDNLGNKVTNTGTLTKLTGSTNPAYVYVAFTNTGTVRVRRGVLSVGGDYHQTATGTLAVPMRGTTPGTNFGQLQISGTAILRSEERRAGKVR